MKKTPLVTNVDTQSKLKEESLNVDSIDKFKDCIHTLKEMMGPRMCVKLLYLPVLYKYVVTNRQSYKRVLLYT